jgi:antitoxin (DNA-binding transcriptional repressor) of toxin-antitoxin stability system
MYTIYQAKKLLPHLIERAARGEEVIIARGGLPVVKLVAIPKPTLRRAGTLKGKLKILPGAFDPLTPEELRELGLE